MTPIQKAKEIIDRYGEYLVKEFKNEPSVDKWLATPEAAALLSGEDWISVEDRLPEPGKIVLTYNCLYLTTISNSINDDKRWSESVNGNRSAFTHWMPLPEPPKP